jgi:TolA-binding protein/thiol-disulfide isomerase/thioredoxin
MPPSPRPALLAVALAAAGSAAACSDTEAPPLASAPTPAAAAADTPAAEAAPAPAAPVTVHGFRLDGRDPGDAEKALDEALALRQSGKYGRAIAVLGDAVAMDAEPSLRAEVLRHLAYTFFRQGEEAQEERLPPGETADAERSLSVALDLFGEVVRRYPNQSKSASIAAYFVGSCHLLLSNQAKALESYRDALARYPDGEMAPDALLRTGVCYAGTGDPQRAREAYRNFLARHRDDPRQQSNVAKAEKYLRQLGNVGRPAPPLRAGAWLRGVLPGGLEALRGEVVVLVFFMTGCGHCKAEMPRLRRAIERWSPQGVVFVGDSDPNDPEAATPIDAYVDEHRIDFFDVCVDPGGVNVARYDASYPAAAIIDRKGVIRWRGHLTFLSHDLLAALIAE